MGGADWLARCLTMAQPPHAAVAKKGLAEHFLLRFSTTWDVVDEPIQIARALPLSSGH
jgi:hypothetical protein